MKKSVLLLSLVLSVFGCKSTAQNSLKPAEFSTLLQRDDILLIDVRTPEEFRAGHIANALNINFYDKEFGRIIGELDNSKTLAIYCAAGNRSATAGEQLKNTGFAEIYNLEGGINAWQKRGFEIVRE